MQRNMSMVAVTGLLMVGLAACGSDEPEGDTAAAKTTTADATSSTSEAAAKKQPTKSRSTTTTTVTSTSASSAASTTTASSTTSPKPKTTSQAPQTSSPETSTTSEDQPGAATEIIDVWVDDSWTIREEPSDVCDSSSLYLSAYTRQDAIFSCGPTAASALACADEGGGKAVCMTNVQQRTAMRFSSPTVASKDVESNGTAPQPLYVELDDGVECASLGRDHDQHWGGKFSWYRCSDDSELLTDEDIHNTFDSSGDTWTVQRSTNKGAPVETSVKTVAYAGK